MIVFLLLVAVAALAYRAGTLTSSRCRRDDANPARAGEDTPTPARYDSGGSLPWLLAVGALLSAILLVSLLTGGTGLFGPIGGLGPFGGPGGGLFAP